MAKFSLNWSAPSNDGNSPVTDYIIQYREVGSPNWLTYSDSISNSNSLIIDNITQCLNYEFRIAAKNATGISSFSNPASDVLGFIPSGVSNIVLSDSVVVTDITLNISWSAPSNNDGCTITDYIIEYSNNGGNTWNRIADGISDTTNYSITNLSVGTYIVRIAAVNVVGSGSFVQSGPITITTTPPPGVMSIAQQPAHYKTIGYGENGTFSTQAVSSNGQPPQYQWQTVVFELIDVEPYIRPRWVDIPNANSSTLSISIETLENFYYNYYEEVLVLNYGFYPGCVRCATTAISCNTAYTEYAILFNFSSFFSTGGVFQDFEDNSYEFIDWSVEVINGTTYEGWYVPQFEVLGIYQSAYRYDFDESFIFGGLTFVPEGTTLGYIYTQKSTDAINWQNVGDTPVNILRTNFNLDAGAVTNFGFTTSTVEYYKSFIMDNWPLPFINILGGDNVMSSIYSNQQSEIVFDDMLNRLKIYWEEQQTLCVTNTELSTFPGSISFNRTYTGYKPLIKSEEYPNRLSLQYRPNEGIWYLSDSNTPVFYTSVSSDLLGTWNDSQSDGFPPIIVSGICPTTTTTTLAPSTTELLLHLDATNHYKDFGYNNYSVLTNFTPTATAIDTNNFVFGDASHNFEANDHNVLILPSFDCNIFNQDFTIEFWTKLNYDFGIDSFIAIENYLYFLILFEQIVLTTDFEQYLESPAVTNAINEIYNQVSHIAIVRYNQEISIYINGVDISKNSAYRAGNSTPLPFIPTPTSPTYFDTTKDFYIGMDQIYSGFEVVLDGFIDEFRISNYAVYTGPSLTVPTSPFV